MNEKRVGKPTFSCERGEPVSVNEKREGTPISAVENGQRGEVLRQTEWHRSVKKMSIAGSCSAHDLNSSKLT